METDRIGMGVIFDLDGVLVDTSEYHKQSWFDLAEMQGYNMSEKFFYRTFGMQNCQILPMLSDAELTGEEIAEMADWKEERYRKLIKGKLDLMDGVEDLIFDLRNNGFAIAIGTSTP
ncbi:MAG: HAD family hydrolase, partial [Planctomycetota bacterium]